MKFKKLLVVIFMTPLLLLGCNQSKEKAVSSQDLWKKNPVDVVARYVENLGNEKRFESVYTDVDTSYEANSENHGYFNIDNKEKIKKTDEEFNASIKKTTLVSALPTFDQEKNKNPITVKNKNGKFTKFYNPISLDIAYKTEYKENAQPLAYEKDLNNLLIFLLVRDNNGDYKILATYN